MLSDTFTRLQNKSYSDSRDFPVQLTEYHKIDGELSEDNRKIKLSERVHSFDSLIMYKVYKSSDSIDVQLINYDDLVIHYSQVDLTVNYLSYDATNDMYTFNVILFRSDTHENQSKDISIQGELGSNNIILFSTIQGSFNLIFNNFIAGAKVVFSMIGYESAIMVVDTINVFVSQGTSNHVYFNIGANSLYVNALVDPWVSGDLHFLVKYLGLGSIITASDLNDIINVVKYYNLLPKFDVTKVNNNDIKLSILGEYYYLSNYIEKFEDTLIQIEDEALLGQQSAVVCFLDIPNHVFNVRRVAVGSTYGNLLADLTEFLVDNPDYEIPLFILVFDTNKNLFEYAYVRNGFMGGGSGGSTINKYTATFSGVTMISFSMTNESYPSITCQDTDDQMFFPDSVEKVGSLIRIYFNYPQSGTIVAFN